MGQSFQSQPNCISDDQIFVKLQQIIHLTLEVGINAPIVFGSPTRHKHRPVCPWIPAWKIVLSVFLKPFWKWFNEIACYTNIMIICHCNEIFQTLHNPIFIIIWCNFKNIICQKPFRSFPRFPDRKCSTGSVIDKPEVEWTNRKLKPLKTFLIIIFFISSSFSSAKWLITFLTEQT